MDIVITITQQEFDALTRVVSNGSGTNHDSTRNLTEQEYIQKIVQDNINIITQGQKRDMLLEPNVVKFLDLSTEDKQKAIDAIAISVVPLEPEI